MEGEGRIERDGGREREKAGGDSLKRRKQRRTTGVNRGRGEGGWDGGREGEREGRECFASFQSGFYSICYWFFKFEIEKERK